MKLLLFFFFPGNWVYSLGFGVRLNAITSLLCRRWWTLLGFVLVLGGIIFLIMKQFRHREIERKVAELEKTKDELERANRKLEEANRKLEVLSKEDALTGIANRRAFDRKIRSSWAQARRGGTPISILFLDIDFFKAFNDLNGHSRGDDALIVAARLLAEILPRSTDFVARYGGEEFCIILPFTDAWGALGIAEKIHKALKKQNIFHGSSPLGDRLTVSIGIAAYQADRDQTLRDFMDRADRALYRAKREGRDRTVVEMA